MDEWLNLKDVVITNSIQQIHCDTRDFHVLLLKEEYDKKEKSTLPWWSVYNDSRFLIPQEEIISFLKRLEEITGGEGEWRFMNFKHLKTKIGWFKYIRLYRVSPTHFIVTDGTYATNISLMTEKNLDKEYLNFIKKDV